jgi:hypothetical protein
MEVGGNVKLAQKASQFLLFLSSVLEKYVRDASTNWALCSMRPHGLFFIYFYFYFYF